MSVTHLNSNPASNALSAELVAAPLSPSAEELAPLTPFERRAFLLTHRMNQGRWKQLMTFFQRTFGATWIQLATYNLMRVYGLENVEAASRQRPILLAANHRSFFDLYAVSSVIFKRTRWPKKLFFPVRAEFFFDKPLGVFVNLIMGWFSMYPPMFKRNEKRLFDKYSLRRLLQLCQHGPGHIIGFHPEGKRNFSLDPYDLLPAQPGLGLIVKQAQPQVIPVFVAGLSNDLSKQVLGNWRGGEPIRIHFGPVLELSEFYAKKDHARTYKEIGEYVMANIAELAAQDHKLHPRGTQRHSEELNKNL